MRDKLLDEIIMTLMGAGIDTDAIKSRLIIIRSGTKMYGSGGHKRG